jgi:hypothetical protein
MKLLRNIFALILLGFGFGAEAADITRLSWWHYDEAVPSGNGNEVVCSYYTFFRIRDFEGRSLFNIELNDNGWGFNEASRSNSHLSWFQGDSQPRGSVWDLNPKPQNWGHVTTKLRAQGWRQFQVEFDHATSKLRFIWDGVLIAQNVPFSGKPKLLDLEYYGWEPGRTIIDDVVVEAGSVSRTIGFETDVETQAFRSAQLNLVGSHGLVNWGGTTRPRTGTRAWELGETEGYGEASVASLNVSAVLDQGGFPRVDAWTQRTTSVDRPDLLRNYDGMLVLNSHYSVDGTNWMPVAYPPARFWINASGYGGGTFVMTGATGQIFTSTDYQTWTARNPGGEDITELAYGNGTFVARKFWSTGDVWVSKNSGVTWTSVDTGDAPDRFYCSLAFGAGKFLYPLDNRVRTSVDGLSWVTHTIPGIPTGFLMRNARYYDGSRFVGAAETDRSGGTITITVASSTDGQAWSFKQRSISSAAGGKFAVAGVGGGYLMISNGVAPAEVWVSADVGETWVKVEGPWAASDNASAFFAAKGSVMAVATSKGIFTNGTGAGGLWISSQPTDLSALSGGTASFSITVDGTGPFTYQWKFNGSDINGATSATYTIQKVSAANGGVYTCFVGNGVGTVTSEEALLTVGPEITVQPEGQAVYLNQTASFSVTAAGTAPLAYQWFRDGRPISGATSATYSFKATPAVRGAYSVRVSNALGSVTSDAVSLDAVAARYTWADESDNQRVTLGGTAGFGVQDVTGPTEAVSYQWFKDGRAVPGATSATLGFDSVTLANAGRYTLVITTAAGKETTAVRVLAVEDPGLLVYSYGATTTDADPVGESTTKQMGFLVVDRANGQAALVLYGKIGSQKVQTTEGPFPLETTSTGPVPGSRTVFHVAASTETTVDQTWFTGRDALVRLSASRSTLAPSVATGTVGRIDGGIGHSSVSLALSTSQTLATRTNEEMLAEAVARIEAELTAKGYTVSAE